MSARIGERVVERFSVRRGRWNMVQYTIENEKGRDLVQPYFDSRREAVEYAAAHQIDLLDYVLETVDYKGRKFTFDLGVYRDPARGPGWYIFASQNPRHGDIIKLIAWPNLPLRKHKHYNRYVRRGWHTKKAATEVMNKIKEILK